MSFAHLIAVTRPLNGLDVDSFIAYVARVSNPSNQNNKETSSKLIKYLIKNQHWSPFEMVHAVIEIETTRDIARQILRHRSFSFQEFSQRYADPTNDLGFTTREARLQDNKNRQNSISINPGDGENVANLMSDWHWQQQNMIDAAKSAYDWAIENGIAKEQARSVLPEGLTNSRMYMSGSLRSWIHYCQLRMANGTQKEHQEIAEACWYELMKEFPTLGDLNV
jgi:thymidylate synthase (FAD)